MGESALISDRNEELHMNEMDIARYLDRGLSDADRERIEQHLGNCAPCRHNLVQAESLVRRIRRPRRLIAAGGFIAVAAAAIIAWNPSLLRNSTRLERTAQAPVEELQLTVYGPIGELNAKPPRFSWASASGGVAYRLTLTNSSGIPVWSHSGIDTVATLPDSVTIVPFQPYVWTVDVLLSDGGTRSTGPREFEISK